MRQEIWPPHAGPERPPDLQVEDTVLRPEEARKPLSCLMESSCSFKVLSVNLEPRVSEASSPGLSLPFLPGPTPVGGPMARLDAEPAQSHLLASQEKILNREENNHRVGVSGLMLRTSWYNPPSVPK